MKSTKGILILALIVCSGFFLAFSGNHSTNKVITQKQKLLTTVGEVIEKLHYSPQAIDDNFSKKIFKKYLGELDPEKYIFLQQDIDALKKYETTLDDEIHGKEFNFFPEVSTIYDKRIAEVISIYKEILTQPFSFTVDEEFVTDKEKASFAGSEAQRKDQIRKRIKYSVLEIVSSLQDEREKSVVDSIKNKTDEAIEKDARAKVLKAMDKMYDRIKVKFTEDERFNLYVNVITNLMDPHSDYFPPVEKRAFDEMMSGRFYGIGAQLGEKDGNIQIVAVMTAGPAMRSGELIANDLILKVAQGAGEPVDIAGFDVADAVKLIRGAKGTEVRLTIKKQDGTTKVVSMIREEIVQDETFARSAVINKDGKKLGYIYLPDFYADFERPEGARCSQDVAKEILKLKAENVEGIILDLRFNGGGSLYEVVQMVGLFIDHGPVVQVRDKEGKSSLLDDKDNSVLYSGPLTVMVNEGSASASEIFAAAIQDYKRGIIVGSTSTFGKGTVQRNIPLGSKLDFFSDKSEFGAIKLTLQKFYRINGGSTQLKGVTSDIVLPDPYDYMKIREKDNPAALPWDEIKKADYTVCKDGVNTAMIQLANQSVLNNPTFKLIKENTQWLAKATELPVSLQLAKYKSQQQKVRSTANQNNALMKIEKPMDIDVVPMDKEKFYNNPDKSKGERYQSWLKNIRTDLYLSQTATLMNTVISNKASTVQNDTNIPK